MKLISILVLQLLSLLTIVNVQAQDHMTDSSTIKWKHFVNVDFELSIPVSKTNMRPVVVPKEHSLVKQMLNTVKAFDLMEYHGSNEEFYCTVQLTAFAENMSMEGIATKLMQQLKASYEELNDKDSLYENIERVGAQRKLYLAYRGVKEHYTVIMYINERRIITVLLSDVSNDQKWTKQFLEAFKII